jgi:beta-phosphoglucomutase-like phosphatase (HAD superfamily)
MNSIFDYDTYIFDFDGVIVDSEKYHWLSYQKATESEKRY